MRQRLRILLTVGLVLVLGAGLMTAWVWRTALAEPARWPGISLLLSSDPVVQAAALRACAGARRPPTPQEMRDSGIMTIDYLRPPRIDKRQAATDCWQRHCAGWSRAQRLALLRALDGAQSLSMRGTCSHAFDYWPTGRADLAVALSHPDQALRERALHGLLSPLLEFPGRWDDYPQQVVSPGLYDWLLHHIAAADDPARQAMALRMLLRMGYAYEDEALNQAWIAATIAALDHDHPPLGQDPAYDGRCHYWLQSVGRMWVRDDAEGAAVNRVLARHGLRWDDDDLVMAYLDPDQEADRLLWQLRRLSGIAGSPGTLPPVALTPEEQHMLITLVQEQTAP